jgi:dihydroneopterin aldolase
VTARDVISIAGLETECVVGVYPRERGKPQPLRVDLELVVDTEDAAKSGRLSRTVDYDATARQIVFLLQSCRFGLLETAAHAIAMCLLIAPAPGERRSLIGAVRLKLIKPEALPGCAVASLEIEREASWARIKRLDVPFGSVDVIHETPEAGIYRLNFGPRVEAPLHEFEHAHDSELVLTPGLSDRGKPLVPGSEFRHSRGAPRIYVNPTRRWQSILCVDSPLARPCDDTRLRAFASSD